MDSIPCPVPRRLGIVSKLGSELATQAASKVAAFLKERGTDPVTDEASIHREADLVVALGGDGTLIHAASLLCGKPVPVLGVNMGGLGFMTEVPQSKLYAMLESILRGEAAMTSRMMLAVETHRATSGERSSLGEIINEAAIVRTPFSKMAELESRYARRIVSSDRTDGVLIATPTGSTAYALAANGPILYPTMDGMLLVPICPHTLTLRPLVLPPGEEVEVTLRNDAEVVLTLDGRRNIRLEKGDRVRVTISANRLFVVQNPELDFFTILRTRLHWGERQPGSGSLE